MAKAIARYCDGCGEKIAAEALEGGVALKIDDAFYCEACKGDVIALVDPKAKSKIRKRKKPDNLIAAVKAGREKVKRPGAAQAGGADPKRTKGTDPGGRRRARPRTGERAGRGEDEPTGARRPRAKAGKRETTGDALRAKGRQKAPARRTRSKPEEAAGEAASPGKPRGKAGARRVRRRSGEDEAPRRTSAGRGKKAERADEGRRQRRRPSEENADGKRRRPREKSADGKRRRPREESADGKRRRRRRDESSEEDFGAPARRRKKKPILLIAGIAAAVLVIGIVAIVAATRSSKPDAGDVPGTVDGGGLGDERAAVQARSEEAFAAAQAEIGESPTEVRDAIDRWTRAMAAFQPMEAAKATEVIADLKERYEKEAQKGFADLEEKLEELQESGRYEEAVTRIKAFNTRYPDKNRSKLRRMIKDVRLAQFAALEAKPLLEKAEAYAEKGDYQLAIGILEGFDTDRYARTGWTPTVRGKILAYKEAESQSEQAASIEAIAERERKRKEAIRLAFEKKVADGDRWLRDNAFEPWFGDDMFTFRFPEPKPAEAWKIVDKVLQATSRGALSGSSEVGAIAGVGSGDWRDYVFEVEYKVVSGSFKLGVRASKRGAFVMLSPQIKTTGDWEKITISARGRISTKDPFQEILAGGSKRTIEFDAHDSSAGGIAFVLAPNSEVHFRNLGVKVLPDKLVLD